MKNNQLNKRNGKFIDILGDYKLEHSFKNGILNGEYFVWYKDNIKVHEGNYKNGKLHGKILEWNKDGSPKSEIYYQDDKKHGKSLEWIHEWIDCNKYIIKIECYYQNNQKNGDIIKYFDDDKIKEKGFYIDD